MISIVSTLAYAVSGDPSKASALFKIDPDIMAIVVAPLAVVSLAVVTLHAAKMLGWKPALRMVGVSMAIVYALEEIGVHTGIVFGRYYFTPLMGPKLDVIPIAIVCVWVALIYIAWVVTNLLIDGSPTPTRHTPYLIILRAVVGARRLSIAPLVIYGLSGLAFMFINFAGQLGLITFYLFGIPFLIAAWKWVVWYKPAPKVTTPQTAKISLSDD